MGVSSIIVQEGPIIAILKATWYHPDIEILTTKINDTCLNYYIYKDNWKDILREIASDVLAIMEGDLFDLYGNLDQSPIPSFSTASWWATHRVFILIHFLKYNQFEFL